MFTTGAAAAVLSQQHATKVRRELLDGGDCFFAVPALPDDFNILFGRKQAGETLPCERLVVDDQGP